MSLSWEQTKSLMRLQAVAQELVTAARRASDQRSSQRSAAAGHRVDALIEQIRGVLAQAETPDLLGEFDRVLQGAPGRLEVIGGGALVQGGSSAVALTSSKPNGDTGWLAQAFEINPTTLPWSLNIHAVCAKVS